MTELLACPFCGGTVLRSGGDDKVVGFSCLRCEASGPNHYGEFEWNTRAPEPNQARLEALSAALRDLRSQADRHYCRSLDQFNKTECLGWEAKARAGEFGKPEFEAHAEANLRMGRHQGMMEAVKRISEILESAALEAKL